jgi:hypothetical protein
MEPNNNNNQDFLKDFNQIPKESIDKSVDLKVTEITNEAIEIVKEYTKSESLGELEIMLIRQVSLFSVKEISNGLPKSSSLNEIETNDTQKIFMENIIYFWNQVIEKLKTWKP